MMEAVHPVDRYVGGRVRAARIQRGLSQTALGEAVGITFQQVQKYERGTNRISASRLFDISKVLGIPVRSFFDGVPSGDAETGTEDLSFDPLDLKILRALSRVKNRDLKVQLSKFIQGLATAGGDGH